MKTCLTILLFLFPLFLCLQVTAQPAKKTSPVTAKGSSAVESSKDLFNKFFYYSDGDTTDISAKSLLANRIFKQDTVSKYYFYVTLWAAIIIDEYKGVEGRIKKLIAANPDFAEAHYLYGQYLSYTGQPGEVEELQKCIEMNPKLVQPYFFLATSYEKAENYKLALTYYNLLEQADANNKSLYYNRAAVKSALKDHAGAIEDYTKVIKKFPGHYRAIFNRGHNYLSIEDYINAEADFTAFLKFMPQYAEAYYYRAYARYTQARYTEACEDFKTAAKLGNQSSITYLETGCK